MNKIANELVKIAKIIAYTDEKIDYDKYVRKTIEGVISKNKNIFDKFELYDEGNIVEIEHKSRDGFIPMQDGGFLLRGYSTLRELQSGVNLPEKAEKIMNDIFKSNEWQISDELKRKYPDKFDENKIVTFSDAEKAGLAKEFEEIEEGWYEEDSVMFELGAFYNDKEDGKHEGYVYIAINFESPYHRRGHLEWHVDKSFNFSSEKELKDKLNKAVVLLKSKL